MLSLFLFDNSIIIHMNIITWLTFGFIVGIIAHLIDPGQNRGGLIGAIVLGIVGSLIGGFLANTLFGLSVSGFDFTSLAVATAGSLLVLMLGRSWKKSTE